MDINKLFNRDLIKIAPYEAVDSPETLSLSSGIEINNVIKLNANENPYGPSPKLQKALNDFKDYHIYPDPNQKVAREALSAYVGVPASHILVGAGADELIDLILRCTLEKGDSVMICSPTFGMYSFSTYINTGLLIDVPRDQNFGIDLESINRSITDRTKVIFLTSPNNPTGNIISLDTLIKILKNDVLVVVDETYYEFSGESAIELLSDYANLVVLRSLSKWAGLAGLRVGYTVMDPNIVNFLMKIKNPYNLNIAAQIALMTSLEDMSYLQGNVNLIIEERERLYAALLSSDGVVPYPSHGNFILCRFNDGIATVLYKKLASRGIFVRYFDSLVLKDCLRISVGRPEHNDLVIEVIRDTLGN